LTKYGVDVLEWLGIPEDGILLDDTYPYPIFENVINY
jgi:hypothetical protein